LAEKGDSPELRAWCIRFDVDDVRLQYGNRRLTVSESSISVPISVQLESSRVVLRAPRATDIPELRSVLVRNGDHLRPFSPSPPPGTNPVGLTELSRSIGRHRRDWKAGAGYVFITTLRESREPIIGRVALTSVTRGPFQSAQLGYWIDAGCVGQGLMSEAVDLVLGFAFDTLALHRVQAAVMPRNGPSRRILERRHFREEGYATRYLRIAGRWEDHLLYALTVEDWHPDKRPGATESDPRYPIVASTPRGTPEGVEQR
jgi:[ribosomal protein S5]-alanine N-acetyltransferase